MNNTKKSKWYIYFNSKFFTALFFTISFSCSIQGVGAENDKYRYILEQNNNDKVCSHMAGVYKQFFKKPFETTIDEDAFLKGGGVMPELLPGAKVDALGFINMGFSFQPTSPEFDAIKWRVGMETSHYKGESESHLNTPFIAADMDINNDGQVETVIKDAFMSCYIPGCYLGHSDDLSIFRKGDIDLEKGPIEWNTFVEGQNGHPPLALIYGPQSQCALVRPFIYDGVTYLSCYSQGWIKDYRNLRNRTPDKEYTDILKYHGVEKLPDGRKPIQAETVCRFRMTVAK